MQFWWQDLRNICCTTSPVIYILLVCYRTKVEMIGEWRRQLLSYILAHQSWGDCLVFLLEAKHFQSPVSWNHSALHVCLALFDPHPHFSPTTYSFSAVLGVGVSLILVQVETRGNPRLGSDGQRMPISPREGHSTGMRYSMDFMFMKKSCIL